MLRIKHVNVNVDCVLCNRAVESTNHLFLKCSFTKACWEATGEYADFSMYYSFAEWALNVLDAWGDDKRQVGVMLCWTIWNYRNDLVWNQKCKEVQEAVNSARVVLSQWKEAQNKSFNRSRGLLNPDDGDKLWSPPSQNKTKINTDAAVFESSNTYSFAFAARNHRGELIEARSICKEGITSPECAEAMGIREALSWIKNEQISKAIIETNYLVAVQAIRGSATMKSYFGVLVQDCRNFTKVCRDHGD